MNEEDKVDPQPPQTESALPEAEAFLSGEEPPKAEISPADKETYLSGDEPPVVVSPQEAEAYLSGDEPGAPPQEPSRSSEPPRARSKWRWIVPLLLILLALFLVLHFCGGGKSSATAGKGAAGSSGLAQQGAAITVAQSKTGDMNIYVDALGTVTPINTVTIYSQI